MSREIEDYDKVRAEAERLSARGYDGLHYRDPGPGANDCGCGVEDLRPCGYILTGCRPARRSGDGFLPTLIRKKQV